MATSPKCRFLFVVLLLFSLISRCFGDNADARDIKIGENNPQTTASEANGSNYLSKFTYGGGQDPNIRKNIEEIVRLIVQHDSAAALEALTEAEYTFDKQIQATADKIMLHLSIYTRQIADKIDSTLREKQILEAIEKMRIKQEAIENNLQSPYFKPQFQNIENNTLKEINELKNKVSALSENNKQLTDTINSNIKSRLESMAIVNNKLTVLENMTSLEKEDIKNLLNITVNIQTSVIKSTQELKALLNGTESAYDTGKISSLCDVKVPSSVKINLDAWKDNQIPVADDLDTYLAIRTGCLYTALPQNRNFDLPKLKFDGTPFEWRLAVRTRESLDMGLSWPGAGYSFFVGQEQNTITRLSQWNPTKVVLEKPTPGLLSIDRYVPVYIRIQNGVLTAGSECERVPFFTRDVTAAPGHELSMLFKSWSPIGAKYLYNCPEPADRP